MRHHQSTRLHWIWFAAFDPRFNVIAADDGFGNLKPVDVKRSGLRWALED